MKNKEYYPFDDFEPDFVNEEGVKWWKREEATQKLLDNNVKAACYNVEKKNGKRSIVLIDEKGVFYETQELEALWIRMEVEIFLANNKEKP